MRLFFLSILLIGGFTSFTEKRMPVSVILDTDIGPDYDDVGALAMLHVFADKGEAEILATISCNASEVTAPALSVINTYFKRPDLPIGIIKGNQPDYPCERRWAEGIMAKYAHAVKSNAQATDAVKLYRKILSSIPDRSATIVSIGYFTNLARLLNSPPDEFSPLAGKQLVMQKVKQLVSMAGGIDSTGNSGYEFNIMADIPSSQKVFNEWPTPIMLSGFELGVAIFTGMDLIRNESIRDSPVKDAYHISITHDRTNEGRYSWDQTAVLAAVLGAKPYFNYRKIDMVIKDDGKDSAISGSRITYLTRKQRPEKTARVIEDLMMTAPAR